MTELSIGIEMDGKEVLIPAIVPTLSKDEIDFLAAGGDMKERPEITKKAATHAIMRIKQGESPFVD